MYQRENGKQTLICTQSLPKTFWIVLKSAFNLTEIWRWGPIDFSWNVEENGGYFHFSKSQICHPTYPMSPPITFRPWMDKLCENKFLGANSASPVDPLDFFKSPPLWGGTKRWQMRRPFERQLWICLWGAAASQDGQWLHQKKKIQ